MTPEQLKASILQYAIQGKLVEQRPEEGTGEELYQKMQTDKQTLIREKKIKKEKPLPDIIDNEILLMFRKVGNGLKLVMLVRGVLERRPQGQIQHIMVVLFLG